MKRCICGRLVLLGMDDLGRRILLVESPRLSLEMTKNCFDVERDPGVR